MIFGKTRLVLLRTRNITTSSVLNRAMATVNSDNQAMKDDSSSSNSSEMDIYRVEIQDGHMNVYMSLQLRVAVNKKPAKRSHATPALASSVASSETYVIPESVRQYERQLRKMQAATRASTPLPVDQLKIIHNDPYIVVVNKPSGVLSVPGVNKNPNLLSLVYETIAKTEEIKVEKIEHMVVHRLDMDTSGVVMFAKTRDAMSKLQALFRRDVKTEGHIQKEYEAVLCGHVLPKSLQMGKIDLPLQRDHRCPPFMRVATPTSEKEAKEVVKGLNHAGWKKIVKKNAKQSQTLFEIIKRDYVFTGKEQEKLPITRVKLTPITGRTHQLRVHCAAIGHPILGDPTYGILGEASQNGGFQDDVMDQVMPTRASTELQIKLDQWAKDNQQVMCLHARKLILQHPITGEELCFDEPSKF
jgi:tRNA pseudouridine32 synthase/23S rRNA pseudouridine746 synthase